MLADTDPTERTQEVHRRSRAVLGPSSLAVGCGYYRSAAFALFAWMSGLLRRFRWHSVEQTASLCQYDAFELQDVVIPEQDGKPAIGDHLASQPREQCPARGAPPRPSSGSGYSESFIDQTEDTLIPLTWVEQAVNRGRQLMHEMPRHAPRRLLPRYGVLCTSLDRSDYI